MPNGLALCKLHHAAFDRDIVGIRPEVTESAALKPDPEFLAERYELFRRAS